jgi:hypothetical protein
MDGTIATDCLMRFLQATPNQRAAIDRFLLGASGELGSSPSRSGQGRAARVSGDWAAFTLRRCREVWQVVFEGDPGFFGHTTGMTFIDHHLKRPGEPIHPVELLAQLQGQEPIQQRSAAVDDQDATDQYLRQMDRLRAIIKDEETSPGKRRVAEEDLAQLEQADDYIYHRTFDKAARAAKSVRQAINRSLSLLDEARDELGRPHAVLVRFAAHVKKYLLEASLAKDVPTGRLVYAPPPGVRWG